MLFQGRCVRQFSESEFWIWPLDPVGIWYGGCQDPEHSLCVFLHCPAIHISVIVLAFVFRSTRDIYILVQGYGLREHEMKDSSATRTWSGDDSCCTDTAEED